MDVLKNLCNKISFNFEMQKKILALALLGLIILVSGCNGLTGSSIYEKKDIINVGIITDLSGLSAATGISTVAGAEIARKELLSEGIDVNFIYEDYQMDSKKAILAAQKLMDSNDMSGLYVEFTPASAAIAPIINGTNISMMCSVGAVSQLSYSEDIYKVFIDFEESCAELAASLKQQGYVRPGYLKFNWEAGNLCEKGLKRVYGDNIVTEGYAVQDLDLNTQLLKLKEAKVDVIINPALESSTISTFKAMNSIGFDVQFATIMTAVTEQVIQLFPERVAKTTIVSVKLSDEFKEKLKAEENLTGKKITQQYNAAFVYVHLKQMVYAVKQCGKDQVCVREKLVNSNKDLSAGFIQFNDRVAQYNLEIINLNGN